MKLDIARIPELLIDNTDRNRTSFRLHRQPFRVPCRRFLCELRCCHAGIDAAVAISEAVQGEVDAKIAAGRISSPLSSR